MPRQYIDPQPLNDRIAALEAENADLKAKLASFAVQPVPSDPSAENEALKKDLAAAEAAIKAADEVQAGDPQSPHAPVAQPASDEPEAGHTPPEHVQQDAPKVDESGTEQK